MKEDAMNKFLLLIVVFLLNITPDFQAPINDYQIAENTRPSHIAWDMTSEDVQVFPSAKGRVVFAGWKYNGLGNTVVISHGFGWYTYYAHLGEIYVYAGDQITSETSIGTIGSTGNSKALHLHFEIRRFYVPYDPSHFITQ
jgi:murein DD-endopeptidase MepM/ murein hydrolase activator NlpD